MLSNEMKLFCIHSEVISIVFSFIQKTESNYENRKSICYQKTQQFYELKEEISIETHIEIHKISVF